MSNTAKFLIGLALGYVGYIAYKRFSATKTVIVDTLDTPIPNVIDISSTV